MEFTEPPEKSIVTFFASKKMRSRSLYGRDLFLLCHELSLFWFSNRITYFLFLEANGKTAKMANKRYPKPALQP